MSNSSNNLNKKISIWQFSNLSILGWIIILYIIIEMYFYLKAGKFLYNLLPNIFDINSNKFLVAYVVVYIIELLLYFAKSCDYKISKNNNAHDLTPKFEIVESSFFFKLWKALTNSLTISAFALYIYIILIFKTNLPYSIVIFVIFALVTSFMIRTFYEWASSENQSKFYGMLFLIIIILFLLPHL